MPRGVYDRSKSKARNVVAFKSAPIVVETDDQIEAKLTERFQVLEDLTRGAVNGNVKALIVSGPAGLGKSYKVEKVLEEYDPDGDRSTQIKGYARATGLMKQLYKHRHKGDVVVFDDADAIFYDDVSLNILKAATDSSDKRMISWMSEAKFEDDDGDIIPRRFEFKGTVVFITNIDFDAMIEKGHKLAPHLSALISRAHYIDLAMKTKRDYYVRIKQVVKQGMLSKAGFTMDEENEVMQFVEKNFDRLRETSLRSVIKIAALRKSNPQRFESLARITCCKNVA
jgi:hypothetical protein